MPPLASLASDESGGNWTLCNSFLIKVVEKLTILV